MKRRDVLTTLSGSLVLLAGCSAPSDSATEPSGVPTEPNQTQDRTETPEDTDQPTEIEYEVSSIKPTSEFPLEYSAEIISGGYSGSQEPIQIEITLSNPTDAKQFYRDARKAFFQGVSSTKTEFTLYPLSENKNLENYQFNTCWSRKNFFGMDSNLLIRELKSGESVTQTVVLATPPNASCQTAPSQIQFNSQVEYSKNGFSGGMSGFGTEITLLLTRKEVE